MEGAETAECCPDFISSKMKALSVHGSESVESNGISSEQDNQPEFLKIECFFNWLQNVEEVKFTKVIEQNETMNEGSGLSACLQVAVNTFEKEFYENCEKQYYMTLYGTMEEAAELLCDASLKVNSNNEISDDTKTGYNYIIKTLKAYLLWAQDNENSANELDILKKNIEDFDDLPLNSQVTVLRLKFMAFLNFRLSRKDPSALQALKKLEPNNAMWHYFLYKYYRNARKESSLRTSPKKDEITSINKAIELEPENLLYIITGFQNMAERLRNINPRNINEENPILWQNKKFASVQDVTAYMQDATLKMLESAELTDPGYYYCLLSSVFSSFLPKRLLDFDLAERCIKKAYEITPTCTTINHRRGLIAWTKDRDAMTSAFYLWQACSFGPKNLGARCDLIHLLLSNPHDRQDVIVRSFEDFLDEANIWGSKEKSVFVFLKGCFLLMINVRGLDILNCWIDAYSLHSETNHFMNVVGQARRYLWDKGLFSLESCRNVFFTIDRFSIRDEDAEITIKISNDISKACEEAEMSQQRFNERQERFKANANKDTDKAVQEGAERDSSQHMKINQEG